MAESNFFDLCLSSSDFDEEFEGLDPKTWFHFHVEFSYYLCNNIK